MRTLAVGGAAHPREQQASLGLGNWTAMFTRRFDPLGDDHFDITEGFLTGFAIRRAAEQFRNFSNERLVILAPVKNHLVLCHSASLRSPILAMQAEREEAVFLGCEVG